MAVPCCAHGGAPHQDRETREGGKPQRFEVRAKYDGHDLFNIIPQCDGKIGKMSNNKIN